MAALIGFGGPLIFILLFILINRNKTTTKKLGLYSILIYVLSVVCGIGGTIAMGLGSIFSGAIFPIVFVILFSVMIGNNAA